MGTLEENKENNQAEQIQLIADLNQTINNQAEEIRILKEKFTLSDKLAFIGQLSAGILHEIKNPLNFVNNFSRLSLDMITELNENIDLIKDKIDKKILNDFIDISKTIQGNIQKVLDNGSRAERIVFGMLAQARENKIIEFVPADVNQMVDEYTKLAYQGIRGENKEFNLSLKFNLDPDVGKVNIVPQDFSRVIINIVNNGCFALNEKKKNQKDFVPEMVISTKKYDKELELKIRDNGTGMPQQVIDKIFKPFFTTKPIGQGTGLGLSMCFDIITNVHKGKINVTSENGEFTEFIITVPLNL